MENNNIRSSADLLGQEKIGKLLLSYSIPAIIGMIVSSVYNIVDRIFIGHGVGAFAISGLALTLPLMTGVAAIGTLVGIGSAARLSIVLGMGDAKWARNIIGNALVLTCVLSFVLVTGTMIYLDDILVLFGGSEQTIPYARAYLAIVIPFSVLTNLSYSFSNMMRAAGHPQKAMITILIGVILNIILDPIFIFVFDMGIRGAAIATVISMFVSAVFAMSHFFNKKHLVHFTLPAMKLKKRIIINIVSIGMAPFLLHVAGSCVNIIMNNLLVDHGGDLAIGAYGIINSYAMLMVMCLLGVCQGMQPIVGYNLGAGNMVRVKAALLLTLKVSAVIMTGGFLICELFPTMLAKAFTDDPQLIDITRTGLRIAVMMFPIVGIQIVSSSYFQAVSKAKKAIFISLTRQVLFLMPLLYILAHFFGLIGIWASLAASDFIAVVVAALFLRREFKRHLNVQQQPLAKE